jgi:hypothetical protein
MPNRIIAEHKGSGVWGLTCYAHDPEQYAQGVNSPVRVLETARKHVDREHPGELFTLTRRASGAGSGPYSGRYRGAVK